MPPFQPVPAKPDHVALEHATLERWERERTFETLRDRNRGHEPFRFIDGPITANNPMGVHHGWGRTLKDIWQRYAAMRGCDLLYQNGFDCQGLWVEVGVEKELGLNSKREIEEYGLDRFSRACRDRVAHFSGDLTAQSKRLGQWMDWERSYYTMTDPNISYIWGFLNVCNERGWLYQGHRSMPWCPRCGTSLSQHELIDSYKDLTHPSLHVRLPLHGRDREYLVVWTTTPWTLPANVAAAVRPDADYARVQTPAGIAIVAASRLEANPVRGEVLGTVRGSELVGLTYTAPFDELPAQQTFENRVVPWDDVSMEEGTGIVHIAPGCGEEDFELGKREGLEPLIPVDEAGAFVSEYGWLHGHVTAEAAQMIVDDLGQRGRLVADGEITHRYPVCWRCGTELIYRLVDEWFIGCDEIREPMIQAAREVEWTPPQYAKRMEDWLRNMGDWCISRKRYWGLPLPFYFCEDGHLTVVGSKAELQERAVRGTEGLEELHRPWIDDVVIRCGECAGDARRVADVGDAWLDAGIVPFSTLGWHNEAFVEAGYAEGAGVGVTVADLPDHAYWEKWYPADWVSEMREQIRLWFYSMLFMGVTLDGRSPYRRVLTYEKVNDETGRPMHKSWGNAIWFEDAIEEMGADVMRWMYAAQPPAQNLNFGYGRAGDVKKRLLTLWNTYAFFITYAGINEFQPEVSTLAAGPRAEGMQALDRWLVARTQGLVRECRAALDAYDSPRLVRAFEAHVDDLSNWYVRLSRSRFWKSDDEASTRAAHETLWYALVQAVRCVAPVMPFLADELWQNLVRGPCADAEPSVHLSGYPDPSEELDDHDLVAALESVRTVVELGRRARSEANLKLRQPLAEVIVATDHAAGRRQIAEHVDLIGAELGVKAVRLATSAEEFAQTEVVPLLKVLGPKHGRDLAMIRGLLRENQFELRGDSVQVGDWTLEPGEFELRSRAREGFAVTDGEGFVVALDTEITPELRLEGIVRDLIRQIQDMRKDAGLEITDRIRLTYPERDGDVTRAFTEHREWIAAETLAVSVEPGAELAIAKA
ncbi:MAG TPA: isoleucine--tRNA ligase [Gaiellales bacterium]|nr:isoleucine--tRNA ligase [Gaiellales bacterium]